MDSQIASTDGSSHYSAAQVRRFFHQVKTAFSRNPFEAHSIFSSGHAQTLAAYAWPRRYRFGRSPLDEERLFEVEAGIKVRAECRWQEERVKHPTVVIWHGMEGSTTSVYMIATADKAFRAGFNIVRVNYRNCGNTEHLASTLYHGGMSGDLKAVIAELISRDKLQKIFPIGFSLGGNMLLKLAGEYGDNPPREVVAACVVSPSVDLKASTDQILARQNWIYHKSFVRSLKRRVRVKHSLFPELYDVSKLDSINTIRDFDEQFTSLSNGFTDANDYYYRSSSTRVIDKIRIPTLIIHSEDDPFIPYEPMRDRAFAENPYLMLLSTKRGGHVAFISKKRRKEDRFWAENRAVEFLRLATTELA